jgi:hypothetical protein
MIEKSKDLTIFRVVGEYCLRDVLETLRDYYEGQPTRYVLWDARKMKKRPTADDFYGMNSLCKNYTPKRPKGKTAYVVSEDSYFELGKIEEILVQISDLPVEFRAFKSMDEALGWLQQDE